MTIIRLSKLVLLALGATVFLAGCKTGEENPATPDMLRKMDADRSAKPAAGGAPGGAATAPSGTP